MHDRPRRTIKSYVLRQGRMTQGQKQAIENLWPRFGIDYKPELLDPASLFHRHRPITLEIGFGNGTSLARQAAACPERDFIGIEVHRPGVGHLLQLVGQQGLENIRVSSHDAIEVLTRQIPDNSLDCVQLFFPDPWHKKRHHKRRIVQPGFIALVRRKLLNCGRLHLATDWEDYANHMLALMSRFDGFVNTAVDGGFATNTGRPDTRFEHRGRRLGHGVWDLLFEKSGTA